MKFSAHEQGTDEWLAERRGVITASRFKDALSTTGGLTEQQRIYVDAILAGKSAEYAMDVAGYKKKPTSDDVARAIRGERVGRRSDVATLYAKDLARERCGGVAFDRYVTAQMRYGTEQEPEAKMAYELERGVLVREVGFFKTDDGKFGVSVDGLVDDDGAIEIKVLASSDKLFELLVHKDYGSFIHQISAPHWLLGRKWTDLVMWTPDLKKKMHVIRFNRDEAFIEEMESGLVEFDRVVCECAAALMEAIKEQ
jgi:hypothetical protein